MDRVSTSNGPRRRVVIRNTAPPDPTRPDVGRVHVHGRDTATLITRARREVGESMNRENDGEGREETRVETKGMSERASSSSSSARVRDGVAGITAGATSTLVFQPLDVIKTRLQVQDEIDATKQRYRGLARGVRKIIAEEGVRGLYAGTTPAVMGSALSWGAYFTFYNAARRRYADGRGDGSGEPLTATMNFMAATEAGIVTTVMTNPIWVIKTRMQLQRATNGAKAATATERPYANFIDAFARIAAKEGLGGLYKGLVPSLVLVSHGSIQFVAYEHLKVSATLSRPTRDGSPDVTASEAAVFGVLSKLFAAMITYPVQVVRSRIQQRMDVRSADAPTYARFTQALSQTLTREGLLGLYKGMTPNILRVLPSSAVTFAAYETVTRLLAPSDL